MHRGTPPVADGAYRTERAVDTADITLRTGDPKMRTLVVLLSFVTVPDSVFARAVSDIDTRAKLEAVQLD